MSLIGSCHRGMRKLQHECSNFESKGIVSFYCYDRVIIQCARTAVVCHMLMLHAVVRGGYQEWEVGQTYVGPRKGKRLRDALTHP